jgi:phosphoribosylanthranilate isomerase
MIFRMIVKICGITSSADARLVLSAGADWIGLNLVAGPRRIDLESAVDIVRELQSRESRDPANQSNIAKAHANQAMGKPTAQAHESFPPSRVVALVNVDDARMLDDTIRTLTLVGIRQFQLYGLVGPEHIHRLCELGLDAIHVQRVSDDSSFDELDRFLAACDSARPAYLLLDAAATGAEPRGRLSGGTGRKANWVAIERAGSANRFAGYPPVLLAGGLKPQNVADAIRMLKPDGVDVSSGVERAPGVKDPSSVVQFIAQARA